MPNWCSCVWACAAPANARQTAATAPRCAAMRLSLEAVPAIIPASASPWRRRPGQATGVPTLKSRAVRPPRPRKLVKPGGAQSSFWTIFSARRPWKDDPVSLHSGSMDLAADAPRRARADLPGALAGRWRWSASSWLCFLAQSVAGSGRPWPTAGAFRRRRWTQGRWSTLVTALFLHGGWAHVLMQHRLHPGVRHARWRGGWATGARGAAAFFAFFLVCGVLRQPGLRRAAPARRRAAGRRVGRRLGADGGGLAPDRRRGRRTGAASSAAR